MMSTHNLTTKVIWVSKNDKFLCDNTIQRTRLSLLFLLNKKVNQPVTASIFWFLLLTATSQRQGKTTNKVRSNTHTATGPSRLF